LTAFACLSSTSRSLIFQIRPGALLYVTIATGIGCHFSLHARWRRFSPLRLDDGPRGPLFGADRPGSSAVARLIGALPTPFFFFPPFRARRLSKALVLPIAE
jgi:hypothetical protein